MPTIDEVRSELQLTTSEMTDADITYAITASGGIDLSLACAKVLEMILMKNQGKRKVRIGNVSYEYSSIDLQKLIRRYRYKATTTSIDDGFVEPDSIFTREGI
jgi:hypothetical protein